MTGGCLQTFDFCLLVGVFLPLLIFFCLFGLQVIRVTARVKSALMGGAVQFENAVGCVIQKEAVV